MEYKYPEGLKFKIVNLDIPYRCKFSKTEWKHRGYLELQEYCTLKHKDSSNGNYQYYLEFDSGLESDFQSEHTIEIMMGKEFVEQYSKNKIAKEHIVQTKPPLGVMPKDIYEYKRVQDLCRALYEYSIYGINYDLMLKWSKELVERLENLELESELT